MTVVDEKDLGSSVLTVLTIDALALILMIDPDVEDVDAPIIELIHHSPFGVLGKPLKDAMLRIRQKLRTEMDSR
jgi:hypothetical protein